MPDPAPCTPRSLAEAVHCAALALRADSEDEARAALLAVADEATRLAAAPGLTKQASRIRVAAAAQLPRFG